MWGICYSQGCQRIFNQMENLPYGPYDMPHISLKSYGTIFCPEISERVHFLCLSVFYLNLTRNTLIVEIYGNFWWLHNSKLEIPISCSGGTQGSLSRALTLAVWARFLAWLCFFICLVLEFYVVFHNKVQTQTCLMHVIVFFYKKVYVLKIPWTE